jgi:hypothetical protein
LKWMHYTENYKNIIWTNKEVGVEVNTVHVSEIPRQIIAGSGLDDWIYWHFDYNYNQL